MNKSKVIRKRQQKKNNRKSNRKSNRKGSKKLKNVKKQKGGLGEELFGIFGDSLSFIGTKKAIGLFGGESRHKFTVIKHYKPEKIREGLSKVRLPNGVYIVTCEDDKQPTKNCRSFHKIYKITSKFSVSTQKETPDYDWLDVVAESTNSHSQQNSRSQDSTTSNVREEMKSQNNRGILSLNINRVDNSNGKVSTSIEKMTITLDEISETVSFIKKKLSEIEVQKGEENKEKLALAKADNNAQKERAQKRREQEQSELEQQEANFSRTPPYSPVSSTSLRNNMRNRAAEDQKLLEQARRRYNEAKKVSNDQVRYVLRTATNSAGLRFPERRIIGNF